jgi:RecB family endonuclease NucS
VLAIDAALTMSGLHCDGDVTDLTVPWTTKVHLSHQPFRETGRRFCEEKHLKKFIAACPEVLTETLRELEGARFIGREKVVRFRGTKHKIDLLFESVDGEAVVVELEVGEPDDGSVSQIERYARAISASGSRVRGILISSRPARAVTEDGIRYELARLPFPASWYWYDVCLSLNKIG